MCDHTQSLCFHPQADTPALHTQELPWAHPHPDTTHPDLHVMDAGPWGQSTNMGSHTQVKVIHRCSTHIHTTQVGVQNIHTHAPNTRCTLNHACTWTDLCTRMCYTPTPSLQFMYNTASLQTPSVHSIVLTLRGAVSVQTCAKAGCVCEGSSGTD